ncbi:hypothetical protein AgCh_015601 [Apium graveolens]
MLISSFDELGHNGLNVNLDKLLIAAAVAWEAGRPLVIEEVDVAPPKKMEVRIRIHFTVIESVEDGVTALKLGEKVLPLFTGECGECRHCKSSESNLCDLLRINLDRGVMLSDGMPRFSKDGKPIYHFVGTFTFSHYTVVHSGCVAEINLEAPLDKVCVLSCATQDLPLAYSSYVKFVQEPAEKGIAGFAIDFLMDGVFTFVSKTVAAPIELVKLLIQNQDKCFSFSEEAK